MDKELVRQRIARRVAQELSRGDLVNLGIGLPTLVANYISDDLGIIFQSENGLVGLGPMPTEDNADPDSTNAGGQPVTVVPGAAFSTVRFLLPLFAAAMSMSPY